MSRTHGEVEDFFFMVSNSLVVGARRVRRNHGVIEVPDFAQSTGRGGISAQLRGNAPPRFLTVTSTACGATHRAQ
ncbi:MAG: hypothetical protein WCA85_17680 [Paraburkholderia sp.]|uniref:hypothetical protein n=1 Tax=Paraburkholderia sp. TaxID=1926495 RepID=UPI003C30F0E2